MKIMVMLHIFAVVLWVGGMFFAHQVLRPVAADQLEPPQRLKLWVGVFRRFFVWVWISVAVILLTGLAMMSLMGGIPLYVHAMLGTGLLMMAIYAYVYFVPYKQLQSHVAGQDWKSGAAALASIRRLVGVNLVWGVITVSIATVGAMFA
jgi:uncharacterized membrane protein